MTEESKPIQPESSRLPKLKVQVWVYRISALIGLEVLLLRLRADRGGYWQPVTGGVEVGEGLEVAALREAQEETGLEFENGIESLKYEFKFYSPRQERECEEHVFALRTKSVGSVVRLDPREHVDSCWVAAADAAAQLKHLSNREGLLRLIAARSK